VEVINKKQRQAKQHQEKLFQKLLHVPEVRKTVVQQTKAKSN
jgi:hypothetical protein